MYKLPQPTTETPLQFELNAFSDSYHQISLNSVYDNQTNQLQYDNQTINSQSVNKLNNRSFNACSHSHTCSQMCAITPQIQNNIMHCNCSNHSCNRHNNSQMYSNYSNSNNSMYVHTIFILEFLVII